MFTGSISLFSYDKIFNMEYPLSEVPLYIHVYIVHFYEVAIV